MVNTIYLLSLSDIIQKVHGKLTLKKVIHKLSTGLSTGCGQILSFPIGTFHAQNVLLGNVKMCKNVLFGNVKMCKNVLFGNVKMCKNGNFFVKKCAKN